jgi:tripartite-type tricarboxylate transporter receptor subunit TctC
MAEVCRRSAGIDVVHVPYRTVTEAQRDLASGRVDFMFAVAPSTLPLVQGGQLNALAIPVAPPPATGADDDRAELYPSGQGRGC